MGRVRHPGQAGSAPSKPDANANPDAITHAHTQANPNPNAIADPAADALADTTAHPVTDAPAHAVAASNTNPASYPLTLGFTNAGANAVAVTGPGPSADSRGADGSPTGATSGSQRGWRWRAAV